MNCRNFFFLSEQRRRMQRGFTEKNVHFDPFRFRKKLGKLEKKRSEIYDVNSNRIFLLFTCSRQLILFIYSGGNFNNSNNNNNYYY